MKVKELINQLLDEPMDNDITIEVYDDDERTSIYVDGLAGGVISSRGETVLIADEKLKLL